MKRHLWDKIDDKCRRCGLERRIFYNGDGYKFRSTQSWEYKLPEGWSATLPDCPGSDEKLKYEKLFDSTRKITK